MDGPSRTTAPSRNPVVVLALAVACLTVLLVGCGPAAPAAAVGTPVRVPTVAAQPTSAPSIAVVPTATALPLAATPPPQSMPTTAPVRATAAAISLYPVTDVVDGDTVKLRMDGGIETV